MEIWEKISKGISNGDRLVDYKEAILEVDNIDKVEYNVEKYTKKTIYIDKNIEVVLIGWETGQSSPIHDHPDNGCIYRILSGNMMDIRYDKDLCIVSENRLSADDVGDIIGSNEYHKMSNSVESRASSIHIYSPPKYKMNIYGK